MPNHAAFPSIEHFAKAQKELQRHFELAEAKNGLRPPTSVTLRGTVKLHGTHADIVFTNFTNTKTGEEDRADVHFQSRNRVIRKDQDNCGFATHMEEVGADALWQALAKPALKIYRSTPRRQDVDLSPVVDNNADAAAASLAALSLQDDEDGSVQQLMIAGEYCGGNIQKGIALSQLPKMFVIFGVRINGRFQDPYDYRDLELPDYQIYNIFRVAPYRIPLDLSVNDNSVLDRLKQITDDVERECPYGKNFSVSGIGEGVVWCVEEFPHCTRFYFKVKGPEHATSRVKRGPKTAEEQAMLGNARNFAQLALPDARLHQGLDFLREMNLDTSFKNVSKYLEWVVNDVFKEEADEILEAGVSEGALRKELSTIAAGFYRKRIKESASILYNKVQ
ncbi:hypothetical protein HDU90_003643 [Geranomyces variabilis]|nr:hypothetical protein HDU90_003643 [Geranomyces variabilis]